MPCRFRLACGVALLALGLTTACAPQLNPHQEVAWDAFKACVAATDFIAAAIASRVQSIRSNSSRKRGSADRTFSSITFANFDASGGGGS